MRSVAMNALLVAVIAFGVSVQGKPAFEPTEVNRSFPEQFSEDWDLFRDTPEATEKTHVAGERFGYDNKWTAEKPKAPIIEGGLGLVSRTKVAHHAISAQFESSSSLVDEPFDVQHGVGFQRNGDCGGGGGILGQPLPEEEILRRQRGEY